MVDFHELYGLNLTVVDIDPAYTLGDMARRRLEIIRQLKEEGVIRYPFLFKLMTSFKHIDQFDAGTYELNSSMDYGQLMDLFFFVAIV